MTEPEPTSPLLAAPGTHVEIELELDSGSERLEFDLVDDAQADFAAGFLGAGTPLGQALLGHSAGERVPYQAGDIQALRILAVAPAQSEPPQDLAARRAETLRKAVDASDRANAVIFASSFSGKWGDYDPKAFGEEEEDQGA